MRDEFSTLDICVALEIPRERLRGWMKEGYIEPTEPAQGQGTKAVFTRQDVYKIALFRLLIERGFKRIQASNHLGAMGEWVNVEYILFMHWRLGKGSTGVEFAAMPFADYPSLILWLSALSKSTWEESTAKAVEKSWGQDIRDRFGEGFAEQLDILQIVNISGIRKRVDMELDHIEILRNKS
jgi:hypothetical protein